MISFNMEEASKNKITIDKNILDLFYNLSDKNSNTRLTACADILHSLLKKKQETENENELSKDLEYCVERLIKGLASPRDAARLGYTLLLTEILKKLSQVQVEEVLELMKKHLTITNKQDKKDLVFGQLFAFSALIRSGRLPNHTYLPHVILSIYDLFQGKNYILNASYEIIVDIFSQLSNENFKEVWAQLKKKLPANWETCSAESVWLLLLCIRMFPDTVSAKYLKHHWGADDIFSSDNLSHFKRIIKQTTSSLPQLHPLCIEFFLLVKERKDFNEIWNAVVDDLFDHEQREKAYIGFEMIKFALEKMPKKKALKIVFSPKFRTMFSRSFLNSKHPMNPAASRLAEFLCNFVKNNSVPELQIMVLKAFVQLPDNVLLDQILKKKEVSLLIQSLLPDAVKAFCEIMKAVLLKKKSDSSDGKEYKNMDRFQAAWQIGNLVAHPAVLTDVEWRMNTIKFLFLNSFFVVEESTSEIPHCEKMFEPLSDALRDSCMTSLYRAVNSLHTRTEKEHSSLNNFLEQLIALTDYAETVMNATTYVKPQFPIEKIHDAWKHLKSMVHKLSKQSKKDGLVNESNAFQALFLQLGLHLFQDPVHIAEVLEELHICCKKALKSRKHEADTSESEGNEPPWIGVVVDILLSLLSKSSKHLRSLVSYVFPLFCPFIDQNALQQILDVINPKKADEDMMVDESDVDEDDQDVDFASGSSSDEESDDENDNQPVDEEFKKKIQLALGPAAEASDAESVVLSDSEMSKLDDALSEAFKSRKKSGHTQIKSEEKTLLHFRVRCFDLIMTYLKSEPPMHLVLMCIEPVLAAFEFGHQSKHQKPLLHKAVSVLQSIPKLKKFQNQSEGSKSELKRLLDILIPKCHKEINMSVSQKLSSLCVFIVLCYRKLETSKKPDKKKSSKTPSYVKTYLSALDTFVSSGSTHMLPHFFTHLMEACPDLSWYFVEPCKTYAFNASTRLFKRSQCLGLLSESLKYSKGQKGVTDEQWLELGNSIFPVAIESLKNALDSADIKPVYFTELLNVIHTCHSIIKERTGKTPLEQHADLLPLLNNNTTGKWKKNSKGKSLRNKIILCLGGKIQSQKSEAINDGGSEASVPKQEKRKSTEENEDAMEYVNGDIATDGQNENKKQKTEVEKSVNEGLSTEGKNKKNKKRKRSKGNSSVNDNQSNM